MAATEPSASKAPTVESATAHGASMEAAARKTAATNSATAESVESTDCPAARISMRHPT